MTIRGQVLIFILLHLLFSLKGQELKFENITTKDGLLSDDVYNLHQDRQGYIWLFTNYGAMKYNGTSFKPVLQNLKFEEAFIYCIYENEKGEKWVANSQARIFRVINDSAFAIQGFDSVSARLRANVNEIYQLHVDDSLNIYAITKQSSFKLLRRGAHYVPTALSNVFKSNDSLLFRVIKRGNSYLPVFKFESEERGLLEKNRKLAYLRIDNDKGSRRFEISISGVVTHYLPLSDDDAYFNSSTSLYHLKKDKIAKTHQFPNFVTNFAISADSTLWVTGYNGGVVKIDARDSIVAHYFPGITVNYILFDSQMGIWLSTSGHGLYHCVDKKQLSYGSSHALGKNISMLKIIGDSIFIGTNGSVFVAADQAPALVYRHSNPLDPLDVARLGNDYLFGFRDRMVAVNIQKNTAPAESYYPYPSTPFRIIYATPDSTLIVHRKGLLLAGKNKLLKRVDVALKTYDGIMRDGYLLLATADGVYRVDLPLPALPDSAPTPLIDIELERPSYLRATKNMLVTRIAEGHEGVIWFCTTGNGLLELGRDGKLTNYTTAHGLPSNIINHISVTNAGLLLLSTNTGHFVGHRASGQSIAEVKWNRTYSGQVNCSEVFRDKLYIGTRTGLVVRTSFAASPDKKMFFNLTGIRIHEQPVQEQQLVNLTYADNDIEFTYDFIDFTNNHPELYYRMSGKYPDSGLVQGNNIRFQNLAPGRYSMFVYPKINEGQKLGIKTVFVLRPAFWQRTWFIILTIVLSILLIAAIVWYGFRMFKLRQERKIEEERLILEYKLIAIKAQVNPHFVSNCLTAIQHLIIDNRLEAATRYIAKFGFLVRQILNFSTRALVTLAEELEITKLNIELEQLRFDQKFKFVLELPESVDPTLTYVPSLILNPLVENAIWHGLLPLGRSKEARLIIRLLVVENRLWLQVEDNGVGRSHSSQKLGNTADSKGIDLTRQRLENINYLYQRNDSELRFSDITDESGRPNGTIVTIVLPMHLQPVKEGQEPK
jgi:hypothetical protein